jgi:transcriptional regulator with XRE-family HTH domain
MVTLADRIIGHQIKLQRANAGLSQAALANAVGVTFQQLQKYERGANRVSASRLHRLALALNVPIGVFFEGIGEVLPPTAKPNPMTAFLGVEGSSQLVRDFPRLEAPLRKALLDLVSAQVRSRGRTQR